MQRLKIVSERLRGLFAVSFLRACASAIISPIIALYLKQFLFSDVMVSIIFLLANGVSIFATIYGSYIIERLQRRKSMIISLLFFCLTFMLFSFVTHVPSIIFIFIIYTFLLELLVFNIIVYIDHFSSQASLGKWYGSNGVVTNLGWFIGPLLGGFIAATFNYITVFIIASLFAFLALLVFIFSEPSEQKTHYHHHKHLLKTIVPFFKKTFFRRAFLVGFGINMLYGTFLLLSLFFAHLNTPIAYIGLYLGFAAIPWIILEFPVGVWADRTKKEPLLFIICYAVLGILLPLFGIARLPSVAFIILCCLTSSTALVEASVVSFFYRHCKESEIEYAGVFMTHPSIGLFAGSLFSTLFLLFLPISYLFIFLAIPMAIFLIVSLALFRSTPEPSRASTVKD